MACHGNINEEFLIMRNGVLLQDFGFQQWYPRKSRHGWYQEKDLVVEVLPTILKVKCLILLPIYNKKEFSSQINKILYGMLSVLALAKDELSVAKVYTTSSNITEQDWQQIFAEINIWQPQFILQLDKNAPMTSDNRLVQTYHPEHLAMNQQDKTAAYQELLTLKSKLHAYDYLT